MEAKFARIETDVKHLSERVRIFWDDVKALRIAWTTITIFIVSLIFGGLIWLDNKQETKFFAVMTQLAENNVKMDRMTHEITKINQTLLAISRDHERLMHEEKTER